MLVIFCWVIPILFISSVIFITYRHTIVNKTENLIQSELISYSKLISLRINEGISASKKISYDKMTYAEGIQTSWEALKKGQLSKASFAANVRQYLSNKFLTDNQYVMGAFYLIDEPEEVYYAAYDYYVYQENYNDRVKKVAAQISEKDSTKPELRVIDGHIFLIRNLYTLESYKKFGTLVVELKPSVLYNEIKKTPGYEIGFYMNQDRDIVYSLDDNKKEIQNLNVIWDQLGEQYQIGKNEEMLYAGDGRYTGYCYKEKLNDYSLGTVIIADKKIVYSEFYVFLKVMLLLMVSIVPVILFVLYFLKKQIAQPVQRLVRASFEIEQGSIGHQIDGAPMPNAEFSYLKNSFNNMSKEVRQLFDFAQNEEIARKDAKILALQSQINPHFLNNTLEMMNWQARMSNDMKTSKMIEALSTLLNYSMGRDDKRLCSLAEEIRCADAYFYIMSMRFGKRLYVEKSVDEALLQVQVPQLILQPLLENAVVHGVEKVKNGMIRLEIYQEEKNVYLKVINSGQGLTKEEEQKIAYLLTGEGELPPGKGRHTSLGIRNVNERIRLIYGDAYGLTIKSGEGQTTESTIVVPREWIKPNSSEKLLNNILNQNR